MSEPLSILVVTASPDRRRSTEMLQLLVSHLAREPRVRVSVWFLRCSRDEGDTEPWPGSRVVDELRTWGPIPLLEHSPLRPLAGALRGRRLRGWLRGVRPDIVLLDDGLGVRVLDPWRSPVVKVVRRNPIPPRDAAMEQPPFGRPDVLIETQLDGNGEGVPRMELPELRDRSVGRSMVDPTRRARLRTELGIPNDVPLIVGWGEDAWLDGTDLFVRTLWALGARHGVRAHGLWLGLSSDPHEAERLRVEAVRCGLAGRFHLHPLEREPQRYMGDAVLLFSRAPADIEPMIEALCSGSEVVTPEEDDLPAGVTSVPPLDIESAARELHDALERNERDEIAARYRLLDADLWLEHHRWAEQLVRLAEV